MPRKHPSSALLLRLGVVSSTLMLMPFATRAHDCRLALVLALDVSSSVDRSEDQLQREGLAGALLAPEVVRAFLTGEPVALYVFEWSGPYHQVVLPPGWYVIESEADLIQVAGLITHSTSHSDRATRTTAVGSALAFAAAALKGGPDCWARTVDIAGDGPNNHGDTPATIYGGHLFDGTTVNALIIGGEQTSDGLQTKESDLVAWFQAEVLHGPGAFWILAANYEDYERAMRVKLLRELQVPMVSGSLTAEPRG